MSDCAEYDQCIWRQPAAHPRAQPATQCKPCTIVSGVAPQKHNKFVVGRLWRRRQVYTTKLLLQQRTIVVVTRRQINNVRCLR